MKITLPERDQWFHKGLATATEITEAHADLDFPDERTRLNLFWFYAGLRAGEAADTATTNAHIEAFILGAALRQPVPGDDFDACMECGSPTLIADNGTTHHLNDDDDGIDHDADSDHVALPESLQNI